MPTKLQKTKTIINGSKTASPQANVFCCEFDQGKAKRIVANSCSHKKNRSLSVPKMEEYRKTMEKGDWTDYLGETITFDSAGDLTGGNTRLNALAHTDPKLKLKIGFNIRMNIDMVDVINSGEARPRKAKDYIRMAYTESLKSEKYPFSLEGSVNLYAFFKGVADSARGLKIKEEDISYSAKRGMDHLVANLRKCADIYSNEFAMEVMITRDKNEINSKNICDTTRAAQRENGASVQSKEEILLGRGEIGGRTSPYGLIVCFYLCGKEEAARWLLKLVNGEIEAKTRAQIQFVKGFRRETIKDDAQNVRSLKVVRLLNLACNAWSGVNELKDTPPASQKRLYLYDRSTTIFNLPTDDEIQNGAPKKRARKTARKTARRKAS